MGQPPPIPPQNAPVPVAEYSASKPPTDHDLIYNIVLSALGGLYVLAILSQYQLMHRPGLDEEGRWGLRMAQTVELAYLFMIGAVLVVRIYLPTKRKYVTMVLNILLLIFVPFGTAVGIYGLWKADKRLLA